MELTAIVLFFFSVLAAINGVRVRIIRIETKIDELTKGGK